MKRYLLMLAIGCSISALANVQGVVVDDQGETLPGANVWWLGTDKGTATDENGLFSLPTVHQTRRLVTSFLGYQNDTTEVLQESKYLTIVLISNARLNELDITERKNSVVRSRLAAVDVQTLTGEELCKAACCNLSESFETSASVDVSYADAATGAKQIRLLGLNGTYVQMLTENTPNIRGLAQQYGMEYIPGTWMQAIQVSKGTSSVVNGYEALTGQINVDYLHPHVADSVAINALISKDLKAELNLTGGWKVNEIAQTALLVHAQGNFLEMDDNRDGFRDMPNGYHLNLLNRWGMKKGIWGSKLLIRGLYDQRIGGQTKAAQAAFASPYVIDLRTRRIDGFWKNGLTFDKSLNRTLGIIASLSYHDQTNLYGPDKTWDANQLNAYLNVIFQTDFSNNDRLDPNERHRHTLAAGASVNYDRYDQRIQGMGYIPLTGLQNEVSPGIFAEYTYNYLDRLTIMLGLREDYSSLYRRFFFTPRMNVRYSPFPWWTLRASAGMGHRTPCTLADYTQYIVTNSTWQYIGSMPEVEQAVNTGITSTWYIPLGKRELQLTAEYYYTQFLSGIVVDRDANPAVIAFYNLSQTPGMQSYAHNMQIEASMEILRGWTMMAAFRYTDVRQSAFTPEGQLNLMARPLQNRFKGIITTSYQTPLKKWQFDLTAQFNGPGRMPIWFSVPDGSNQYYQKDGLTYHRWYPQLLAQVTKYFRTWSLYLGAENMTNFTQDRPIIGERNDQGYVDPYSADYDAATIWGPLSGWKLYLGFRWALEKDK